MALLEIIIGIVFILAFLSLVCSAIVEWIAGLTRQRAATLKDALSTLLHAAKDGGQARDALFQHPVLRALSRTGNLAHDPPSYIPAKVFADALFDDVARRVTTTGDGLKDFRAGLATLRLQSGNPDLARALEVITADVHQDLAHVKARIAAHFDTTMERVSGWYKRHASAWLAGTSLVVAGVTNADVFAIGNALARDSTLRAALVAAAERTSITLSDEAAKTEAEKLQVVLDETAELRLPLGWSDQDRTLSIGGILKKLAGIFIAAAALTLGAPFWFDTLKKLLNLRASGAVPETRKP